MIVIRETSPYEAGASTLLRQSHALMEALFPPDENFALDLASLNNPNVQFYTAHITGRIVGTAALVVKGHYGELKAMFVDETARGKGVAKALLAHLEADAKTLGLHALRLETGEVLRAACRLYRQNGFIDCGPFGAYTANKTSVFMEKRLLKDNTA